MLDEKDLGLMQDMNEIIWGDVTWKNQMKDL